MSNRTGRRLELEVRPQLIDEICDLLEQGCAVRTACECTGLSESAFYSFVRRAQPDAACYDERFLEFAQRTTRARGIGKSALISFVNKAALHDWRAAIALLERLSPDEYGRDRGENAASKSAADADTACGHLTALIEKEAARSEPDQEKIVRLQRTLDDTREDSDATLRAILDSLASG